MVLLPGGPGVENATKYSVERSPSEFLGVPSLPGAILREHSPSNCKHYLKSYLKFKLIHFGYIP